MNPNQALQNWRDGLISTSEALMAFVAANSMDHVKALALDLFMAETEQAERLWSSMGERPS